MANSLSQKFHKIGLVFILMMFVVMNMIHAGFAQGTLEPKSIANIHNQQSADPTAFSWNTDGSNFAIGFSDGSVSVWTIPDEKNTVINTLMILSEVDESVTSIALSADGSLVSGGFSEGVVRVWDTLNGELLFDKDDHRRWVHSLAWSPDNKLLSSSSSEETIIWTMPNGNQLFSIPMSLRLLRWTPHSDRLIGNTIDTLSLVWDLTTHDIMSRIHAGTETALSPDGSRLVGVQGNRISTWNIITGQMLVSASSGHHAGISSVSWSSDSQRLASGSGILGNDYTVRMWNADNGNEEIVLTGHEDNVISLLWYPDDSHLVSVSFDDTIRIWDTITGRLVGTFRMQINDKGKIAVSPNGELVATIDGDGSVNIWDISVQQ